MGSKLAVTIIAAQHGSFDRRNRGQFLVPWCAVPHGCSA